MKIICLAAVASLAACASTDLKIHSIDALSTQGDFDGSFKGLEGLADQTTLDTGPVKTVNIFYLHGIGWTEDPDKAGLANDFLAGLARAYGRDFGQELEDRPCGSRPQDIRRAETSTDHIIITPGPVPVRYETIIPDTPVEIRELVCMDKKSLLIEDQIEFVVYRIFWDNKFWDQVQAGFVGYDSATRDENIIYNTIRRQFNRDYKDELINYGISDAVMYLGAAGEDIRNAVRGAMCSAALDAAGRTFQAQGGRVSYQEICDTATSRLIKTNQFAFVTESLGSKIAFDVMREAMTDDDDNILDAMVAGSETYMLANQLALLSLADISKEPGKAPRALPVNIRPKIIAMSEVNDFLSYEINPFFESLWHRQHYGEKAFDNAARAAIINGLGFEFIDMRVEFADPVIPFIKGLVDPEQAHLGHKDEPELIRIMLCGARNGTARTQACLAAKSAGT